MSFLSVIVDCNVCNWGAFLNKTENDNDDEKNTMFQAITGSIIAFCNAHLHSSVNNNLLVLAGGITGRGKKLFSTSDQTNPLQISNAVHEIDRRLREVLLRFADNLEFTSRSSSFAAAVSLSICAFQTHKRRVADCNGRVVIINLTTDLAAEQNILMNLFFSANQYGLQVNVASLGGTAPILQQACDITSGTHILVSEPRMLLHYLMLYCFGCSPECREIFASKREEDVDYRATCHCHNRLVDIGWVCTVCLSIHCLFQPLCSTCNVHFANNMRKRKEVK